ncbi:hypothetical protein SJAG_02983 [Schizosaccharomyces japonicus yFS275]|uniref:Uncharacterized protein n=1 Tax=Schizosaccharomyces japonicus (strain yFS275 / FY16936) TaxID=402676 RepID=B6K304_SCHJY|nr:hypothetical protein SJAG_02983 [Schizosaccharomyces japonicus yFS275]EEB07861.1 hypothetical protein SJAG_02983 [Schizosaccharomyces japonicus yFS275]
MTSQDNTHDDHKTFGQKLKHVGSVLYDWLEKTGYHEHPNLPPAAPEAQTQEAQTGTQAH